ncbi:hypothetical protein Droror1_Dr00006306 [Drosera rotundifolia]
MWFLLTLGRYCIRETECPVCPCCFRCTACEYVVHRCWSFPFRQYSSPRNCFRGYATIVHTTEPTLMFVLRDQTRVEVEALISFELCEEQFEEQVANLRHKISNSIASGAHGGDQGAIDASSFSFSAREMWEQIKANNDLDLPALRVLIVTVRCEEIANNMFTSFTENEIR